MIHTLVKIQFIVLYIPYCSNYQRGRDKFIYNGRKRKEILCLVKVHRHITESTTALDCARLRPNKCPSRLFEPINTHQTIYFFFRHDSTGFD